MQEPGNKPLHLTLTPLMHLHGKQVNTLLHPFLINRRRLFCKKKPVNFRIKPAVHILSELLRKKNMLFFKINVQSTFIEDVNCRYISEIYKGFFAK